METTFNQTVPQTGAFNDIIVAKVVTMCVLGIASFVVGMIPTCLKRLIQLQSPEQHKNLTLSLMLCFGGGVLLYTTFLHLLPEVRESFERLESENKIPLVEYGISTSELTFCLGFFLVYFIEELVHSCLDRKTKDDVLLRSLSVRCKHTHNNNENVVIPRATLNNKDGQVCTNPSHKGTTTVTVTDNADHDSNKQSNLNKVIQSSFSGLLTVLALSFHAIFEGLAVGLENETKKVWYLLIAVATHKLVIGFCVGVELVTSKTKLLMLILYIGTYAIVTPLGILAGLILSNSGGSGENVVTMVLQAMAAGTLLYVVFFEVLAREKSNVHSGLWQLLAILSGFVVMCILQVTTGHTHSHDHSH